MTEEFVQNAALTLLRTAPPGQGDLADRESVRRYVLRHMGSMMGHQGRGGGGPSAMGGGFPGLPSPEIAMAGMALAAQIAEFIWNRHKSSQSERCDYPMATGKPCGATWTGGVDKHGMKQCTAGHRKKTDFT